MCTLGVWIHRSPAFPVVVAANRDEFYARPTAPPDVIAWDPWIFAGQDRSAGGTWLGLNQHGVVVGLLNRRHPEGPDPARRSRGLLCLEALSASSRHEVVARVRAEPAGRYNWLNLLAADREGADVVSNVHDRWIHESLPVGLHVLTNLARNDTTCPRAGRATELLGEVPLPEDASAVSRFVEDVRRRLADHRAPLDPRGDPRNTLCIHSPAYGTRSSSIVLLPPAPGRPRYFHADAPPCTQSFAELFPPEKGLALDRSGQSE